MLLSFYTQTVTRIRPATKIVRGSEIPDWEGTWDILEIPGCSVQPAATSLSMDGRVLGINDGVTCYMPADADVREGDRIVFKGKTYTINGDPRDWPSATGRLDHIQLNLVRWQG